MSDHDPPLSSEQLAALSAYADGRLPHERRAEVEAMVDASPTLRHRVEREQWLLSQLDHAAHEVRAPERLRAEIERATRTPRPRRRPTARWGVTVAAGFTAIVVVLILALPARTPGAPALSQAAALADRGPVRGAPVPAPGDPAEQLFQAVGGVYFPNWARRAGLRATGERVDMLGGHRAVTVYYAGAGRRVAYTIVSAPALRAPSGPMLVRDGLQLRTVTLSGRLIVTWRRNGNTCLLSGSGVSPDTLQQLAARSSART